MRKDKNVIKDYMKLYDITELYIIDQKENGILYGGRFVRVSVLSIQIRI